MPIADICLFDHFVGAGKHGRRHGEAERLGGLEVEHHFVLVRCLHRQISWLLTLPIPPDGPVARMVSQELVRVEFYRHTPAEGTPEQKRKVRHMQFSRSLAYAEGRPLVGVEEIGDVTYLRLNRPDPRPDEAEFEPQGPKPDPQILEEDLE